MMTFRRAREMAMDDLKNNEVFIFVNNMPLTVCRWIDPHLGFFVPEGVINGHLLAADFDCELQVMILTVNEN